MFPSLGRLNRWEQEAGCGEQSECKGNNKLCAGGRTVKVGCLQSGPKVGVCAAVGIGEVVNQRRHIRLVRLGSSCKWDTSGSKTGAVVRVHRQSANMHCDWVHSGDFGASNATAIRAQL